MARKRPPKRREGKRPRKRSEPPGKPGTIMSSDDLHANSTSRRQSSEATFSEPWASDGVTTAMTSVLGTDEEIAEDVGEESGQEISDDDDDGDLQSVYMPEGSHMSTHRSEATVLGAESFMANSDVAASTRSLWARDLDYREIHGRLYCREWFKPIDNMEQMRMSLQHQVCTYVLNDPSTLQLQNPTNILDVGTGTGEWAIRMAELYPNCEVVGTDIAAVAETRSVPMNVFFEIEDAEEWDRCSNLYDLIHFRTMEGAFKDWSAMYRNVYKSLKPGGWLEVQDFDTAKSMFGFAGQFSPDSPIHDLVADLSIATEKSGRSLGNDHQSARAFLEADLVDVRTTEYQIPISIGEKSAGKIWLVFCLDALEAACLRLLTEYMGWDPDKLKAACEDVGRELVQVAKDTEKSKGLVVKMNVAVGRKPLDAPLGTHRCDHCEQALTPTYSTDQENNLEESATATPITTTAGTGTPIETANASTPSLSLNGTGVPP